MRDHDYERAEEEDRLHFFQCAACGKWIDSRDLSEVLEHRDHDPPSLQSSTETEA
jgi:hypothetical protein